ncbi:hypothetical protein BRL53_08555 [Corynebacterium ulcerans]|nr:hypothetical protein BRL53_08555 [Corynebacterium ulcerans]
MIAAFAVVGVFWPGRRDGDGVGVDDGDAEFDSVANGVGRDIASSVHSRFWFGQMIGFAALILYQLGPLYVVPPRSMLRS